jgi:hypothetical protein
MPAAFPTGIQPFGLPLMNSARNSSNRVGAPSWNERVGSRLADGVHIAEFQAIRRSRASSVPYGDDAGIAVAGQNGSMS